MVKSEAIAFARSFYFSNRVGPEHTLIHARELCLLLAKVVHRSLNESNERTIANCLGKLTLRFR